jgi:hypothetical protein
LLSSKGEWLETRPGKHCLIRVSAKDIHGLYSLVEILSDPGDGTPMHIHERGDEQEALVSQYTSNLSHARECIQFLGLASLFGGRL